MTGNETQGGSETILLVEDQEEVAQVAQAMLEELGYSVVFANSAQRALDILGENKDIDLLLTDIVMPGPLNGAALAERVKTEMGLKAVLVTGYADKAIPSDQFGRFNVILKPFGMDELGARIRAALDA
ncbi:response regulator [Parasphingopyxis lamellibrachiae]|uniref:response regulator n=1 Tax=Parasphingopyxis lamellibrachiae TaxID=680125 RepID=UPI0013C30FAC|nr:response regulator [Parasphingopyxis lamellibrachiae]